MAAKFQLFSQNKRLNYYFEQRNIFPQSKVQHYSFPYFFYATQMENVDNAKYLYKKPNPRHTLIQYMTNLININRFVFLTYIQIVVNLFLVSGKWFIFSTHKSNQHLDFAFSYAPCAICSKMNILEYYTKILLNL